jgi:hypothetical protein
MVEEKTLLFSVTFFVSVVGIAGTFTAIARRVNRALPPDEEPFSSWYGRQRIFRLVGLHRRMFPKSWLPQLEHGRAYLSNTKYK